MKFNQLKIDNHMKINPSSFWENKKTIPMKKNPLKNHLWLCLVKLCGYVFWDFQIYCSLVFLDCSSPSNTQTPATLATEGTVALFSQTFLDIFFSIKFSISLYYIRFYRKYLTNWTYDMFPDFLNICYKILGVPLTFLKIMS